MSSAGQVQTEYVACDLCGSADHEILFSKIDPVTGAEYHLVECSCGMALVNPMPAVESIPKVYPGDYHEGKDLQHSMYDRMLALLPSARGGKLLDVGCGTGDFILRASRIGWDVEGVDLLDWNRGYNIPIRVGDFVSMDFPEGTYDVVTAWALLEHVRRPSLFFEKISRLLREHGLFIFVVPNIAAPGIRHSCSEDIPKHLWLFSPVAVRRYLDRYAMEVVSILHDAGIYTAYPFGLLRYGFRRLRRKETRCAKFENKSVALLRNRRLKGNFRPWVSEAIRSVGPVDLFLDAIDLGLGVLVAGISRMMRNYGIVTVIARKKA